MSFISKAVSVGGSLMVTIPKEVVKMLNIHSNEQLELDVKKMKISGFGMFRGIGHFTKEDELHFHE